ncbi:MAG: winged helix-turn-helix domain-containing protein [bacterium]|nr:winged helix-turn-helix domain-containing protein [bacterium]
MDKLIKIFIALSDEISIRIVKLLIKKMCTIFEISEIMSKDEDYIKERLDKLMDVGIVSKINDGKYEVYFVKNTGSIFDKFAKDIVKLLSGYFNSDKVILDDYQKARSINRDELFKRRNPQ